jgi:hypothetical protein
VHYGSIGILAYWNNGIKREINQIDWAFPTTSIIPVFHYPNIRDWDTHLKGGNFEDGNNRRRESPAACLNACRFYIKPASL